MGSLGRSACKKGAAGENLKRLRLAMQAAHIQACIVPTTDPHISEYTPAHWKTREWLSGFTGSAGTVVVTLTKAGLWTDSRYFLQAGEQLQGSGIELFKTGLPDTPDPVIWLNGELSAGDTVGLEGDVYTASDVLSLIRFLRDKNIQVKTDFAPYNKIWENRPEIPANQVFILPEKFTGESPRSKIQRLLKEMEAHKSDLTVLASLDMIAWLFNLRGNDIEYNPVAVGYAVVSPTETALFMAPEKLTPEVVEYLTGEGIALMEYDNIYSYIAQIDPDIRILLSPNKINYRLYTSIPTACKINEVNVHPADAMKAIKNEQEIAGFRKAMQRDGVAWIKFYFWLEKQLKDKQPITELDVSKKLKEFRSRQDYFFSESFKTTAGYAAHGAIVHYVATPESNLPILPESILLIDSGAQYLDGTTDITRTIALGKISDEMKIDYTNVLKGHIQLAMAKFPKGTVGMQLDVLARQFIWKEGQNYLHGTGHGVGHFLNVHEGPQSIRMNYNPASLQPGMITSDEPGLYKAGKYGIRIENLLLTVPYQTTEFGEYYAFETLTLCPIDKKLINREMLSNEEINWIDQYHQQVWKLLSPDLSEEEKDLLKIKISPIFEPVKTE